MSLSAPRTSNVGQVMRAGGPRGRCSRGAPARAHHLAEPAVVLPGEHAVGRAPDPCSMRWRSSPRSPRGLAAAGRLHGLLLRLDALRAPPPSCSGPAATPAGGCRGPMSTMTSRSRRAACAPANRPGPTRPPIDRPSRVKRAEPEGCPRTPPGRGHGAGRRSRRSGAAALSPWPRWSSAMTRKVGQEVEEASRSQVRACPVMPWSSTRGRRRGCPIRRSAGRCRCGGRRCGRGGPLGWLMRGRVWEVPAPGQYRLGREGRRD